ncbi:type VI secretion system tip protein VgrG [Salmonella enterica subsp. enterica]|nr:type VI secretion system tip protein VgrG [Salmonella enterica subsp. enterica]
MSLKGLRFTLNIDGLAETSTAVVGFRLVQHYSRAFMLKVDIASDLPDLAATDFLEKNAVLTVWQGMEVQRSVSGIITAVTLSENNHWQMGYHLIISSPLWRCGLRQNFRIFQQQDIQTITSTLLNENGVTEWAPVFYEGHPAREFCVQYGESDLAFLTRLWSEEGIFFYDWHATDSADQKLVLTDDAAGASALATPLPFNPNISAEVSVECISQFRYHAQIRPSSVETQDYTFKTPGWPGYYGHDGEHLNGQQTQYEIFDYPGRFKDESHGQAFARYQTEGWRNNAEMATGYCNSPKLYPGKRFMLSGHPSETLNREWQVVGSTLTGEQPQALHGSQGQGTTLSNRIEVIPADRTWRTSPLPKPSVDGPQSAIVTGPPGEEIFCDEHGRVRVRFHWDRYCPGNEDSSCWIRVSQPWAGAGFGHLAIPRVGQEVIVDFLNGDPDQPIIMGRTYHQDNRSPGSLPGTKTQMTIRSKTYKGSGFNELKFDDATGKEQVYIHAQKNMDTEVLNNRTTDVKVDHTETIGNNQKITVGLGQTVTVGKDNAVGHDQTISVTHDQSVSIGNDQTLKVTNNRTKTVGNDQDSKVTGNDTEAVEKSQTITIGEALSVTVTDSIEFVCGKSTLRMDKDGYITINGHELSLGTTGEQYYKADGDINLQAKTILEN